MYIAMNRFKVKAGCEQDFEAVWKNRETRLDLVPGFMTFHLLKGPPDVDGGTTLYASHTTWASHEDFLKWTKSDHFREAHKNAGTNKPLYDGPPQFEGFEIIEGA